MLMPKRVKYRRVHRGRLTGKALRGNVKLQFCFISFAQNLGFDRQRILCIILDGHNGEQRNRIFCDYGSTCRVMCSGDGYIH